MHDDNCSDDDDALRGVRILNNTYDDQDIVDEELFEEQKKREIEEEKTMIVFNSIGYIYNEFDEISRIVKHVNQPKNKNKNITQPWKYFSEKQIVNNTKPQEFALKEASKTGQKQFTTVIYEAPSLWTFAFEVEQTNN
jgi:hypothetical protein